MQLYCPLIMAIALAACGDGSSDPVKNAEKENREKIDSQVAEQKRIDSIAMATIPSKQDADFVVNAASGGMLEVQLGELAQTNAKNPRVKAFGAMMIKDHSERGRKLKEVATARNITLSDSISKAQQKEKDQLQKKKGDAFDDAYMNLMADDHRKDISEFEKEVSGGTHPSIKAFASNTLPVLRMHLDSALSIQKIVSKKTPVPVTPLPVTPVY